ncbi:MAG: UDP-N-acetyl-D-glucosamine dehydrogenase [Phycisphaerae bacterium]|nr:UDP-N-acetyl-D-glucosamine dehydrogenase [Phycisphaerae bacterium]OUX02967.1 MAG: UDP-N-acetyl-D-glucosamine dehydrogenase [Phycisphaeraceae bacterium TMED231]
MPLSSNSTFRSLQAKIEDDSAIVGVIGLGYVGLPLAHALHRGGMSAIGFDVDERKIEAIAAKQNYLRHLGDEMIEDLSDSDRFTATTRFDRLGECDVIIIAVPTPLGRHQEPDLSYITDTAERIGRTLRPGQLVILESTTYPRTTRDEMLPVMLEHAPDSARDLVVGEDLFVAFSPEREDPGRKDHSTSTIPKLVGGLEERSTSLAADVYRKGIAEVVEVASAEIAESAKLLENIFRAVNIALVNEMKTVLTEMDIDIWEVVRAASTKPFGFMPFFPGPGLGGHCIPIDPFYLTWKAKEVGCSTRFIELAGQVNTAMPEYVIDRVAGALNEHAKPIKGSKILVMGLAYKPDVDDTRESPSFELIKILEERGAEVDYSDPHIAETSRVRRHDLRMTSVELTPERIASFDCILISTNHAAFDYPMVAEHARLVVDTRDAMRDHHDALGDRLVLA